MLSDRDLKLLAESYRLVDPFNVDNCEGSTINLTLNSSVKKYISKEKIILGGEVAEDQYQVIDLTHEECYLQPTESALVQCYEYLKIPPNMSALILERHSIKLLGLSVSPASYLNPGYEGRMTFVVVNNAPVPIQLAAGIGFCQLAIFELSTVAEKPYKEQNPKYQKSSDVSISKLHLDKEIQGFLKTKGIKKISQETAKDLGEYLMAQIQKSACVLANVLRREFGNP